MSFRPAVVRGEEDDVHQSMESLGEQERRIREQELQVAAETARLKTLAGTLHSQVAVVNAAAARLTAEGRQEAAWQPLLDRVAAVTVPAFEPGPAVAKALAARHEALRARAQAVEESKKGLSTHAAALSRLTVQLKTDQVELEKYEDVLKIPPPPKPPARVPTQPPPPPTEQGRRQAPRVRMQVAIDFGSDSNFFTGFSTNISEGGIFIATVQAVQHGTPVELGFSLPSGRKITAHGVVRWTREVNDKTPEIFPGIGVQFSNLTAEAAEAIREFVSAREPLFYPD